MVEFDTITAISTPSGEGGIGIIRISGPLAEDIGKKIIYKSNGEPWDVWEERKVYFGSIYDQNNERLDEAIFFLFRKPKSYTREDTVEIQMHGNPTILRTVLEIVIYYGARLAEPGEFTRRAFLNGRIDLAQAEGVIDLIRARTLRGGKAAAELLAGELSIRIKAIRDKLLLITAKMEAELDYPEDEFEPTERGVVKERLFQIKEEIMDLLKQGMMGQYIREGITVVLAGRPNVGKSSILNSLLRKERAIVTEIPGTTRDIIEEEREIQGIPIRLIDTAGLRESDNLVEQIGIQRAEDWLKRADIILLVLDGGSELSEEDHEIAKRIRGKNVLYVVNKTDNPIRISENELQAIAHDYRVIYISALTRDGLKELEEAILRAMGIQGEEPDREILLTHVRHKEALINCKDRLEEVMLAMEGNTTDDLLVIGLRSALVELGKITGENMDEEVINEIFDKFCLGK